MVQKVCDHCGTVYGPRSKRRTCTTKEYRIVCLDCGRDRAVMANQKVGICWYCKSKRWRRDKKPLGTCKGQLVMK